MPIRIVLIGQVNAGKSSLLNALAQEIRCAVGPLPTTSNATEHLLDLDGRPCVMLVDLPGLDESTDTAAELLVQAERADLIMWVASATQPARGPDRKRLDDFRAWADAQLARSLGRLDVVVQRLGFVPHLHERVLDYVANRYDADQALLLDYGHVAKLAHGHLLHNGLHGLGLSASR